MPFFFNSHNECVDRYPLRENFVGSGSENNQYQTNCEYFYKKLENEENILDDSKYYVYKCLTQEEIKSEVNGCIHIDGEKEYITECGINYYEYSIPDSNEKICYSDCKTLSKYSAMISTSYSTTKNICQSSCDSSIFKYYFEVNGICERDCFFDDNKFKDGNNNKCISECSLSESNNFLQIDNDGLTCTTCTQRK